MLNNKIDYFNFVFTEDGSTGLYNKLVEDVYHSKFGAKSEAEEKFIKPLNFEKNFLNKKQINVLDICYGIGYNTKAFLNKIIKTNYNGEINIDILEYDKDLVLLSPFIKDGYYKSAPEINYILASKLIELIYANRNSLNRILNNKDNKKFIEPFYGRLIKKYKNWGYIYNLEVKNSAFLHNICYHYISQRNKRVLKSNKINKLTFRAYFEDARQTVKSLKNEYDVIFLDAFTPSKLPTLWSLDFFKELYRLSSDDGMLVTYSNSSAVRHAMMDAGYYVGKIYDKKKYPAGTVASKNISLIENELNEYDKGLMKTNAGIYFLDEGLKHRAEEILEEHAIRKKLLNLESSSQYIKRNKKEHINA